MLPYFFGRMGEVELDRPAATCSEVYEEGSSPRVEEVSRMLLAVQRLVSDIPGAERGAQPTECVAEEFPVGLGQLGGLFPVVHLSQGQGDSIGEMRCVQIDLAQGGMVPQ